MKCPQCGTVINDGASFCHSCGSQVSDAEGQARASGGMDTDSQENTEKLLKQETKGEFVIERLLGRGGMAMVYLSTEVQLERKVAIKVLPPELTFGHGVERFVREARTAARLDHSNIIPIYRISSGGKLFWYAMKYLEGQSLEDMLREKGRLSLAETIQILTPIADALDYGHLHSVIHRDIKPANIMLDPDQRVVVTDFGIAKALKDSTLTATGSVIGTPFYMSPEQGMGKPVTGASDQYSLAVMAYRMLSGQTPFEGDSALEILNQHCSAPPPPLQQLAPNLPDYVYKAIEKALSKKPAQRFSNVKAFVSGLKKPSPEITASEEATVLVDSDPSIEDRISTEVIDRTAAPTPAPPRPATGPNEKRREFLKLLIPLLAIVAAGIGAGWWWMTQRTPSQPAPPMPLISDQAAEPAGRTVDRQEAGDMTLLGEEPVPRDRGTQPAQGDETFDDPEQPTPQPEPASPSRYGTISITGMMPSGLVMADGEPQNGHTFEIEPGQHVVEMRQPGYESVTQNVSVSAGRTVTIDFAGGSGEVNQAVPRDGAKKPLSEAGYGTISILLRPSIRSSFFVDGFLEASESTSLEASFPEGVHSVRIESDGYMTIDTTVVVAPGDTVRLRLRMRK